MRGWGALARWAPFFDDGGNSPSPWNGAPNGTFDPAVGTAPLLPANTGELAYWQDRAARLDPNAYVFRSSAATDTVPNGEAWYSLGFFANQATAASSTASGAQSAAPAATTTTTTAVALPGASSLTVSSTVGFAASGTIVVKSGTNFVGILAYTSTDATHFLGVTGLSYQNSLAIGATISQGTGTLNLVSTAGFAANGTLLIGGTTCYYTGISVNALTGCVSTPAVLDGAVVSQVINLYQRVADAERALLLPAGQGITAGYYCRPSLVVGSDARYANDPKGLYYARLNTLRTLPLNDLAIYAPPGTAMGTTLQQNFPGTVTSGIVMLTSITDMAWIGLRTPTGGTFNIFNEISDDHAQRTGQATCIPFLASVFNALKARAANPLGVSDTAIFNDGNQYVEPGLTGGYAGIKYVNLPGGW